MYLTQLWMKYELDCLKYYPLIQNNLRLLGQCFQLRRILTEFATAIFNLQQESNNELFRLLIIIRMAFQNCSRVNGKSNAG